MDGLWLALGAAAGLALGIWGGLAWGGALRTRSAWRYWRANALVLVAGTMTVFLGTMQGWSFVWAAGVGLMGGGITGLKYGFGRSVGIWRTVDRLTGVDDLPRE